MLCVRKPIRASLFSLSFRPRHFPPNVNIISLLNDRDGRQPSPSATGRTKRQKNRWLYRCTRLSKFLGFPLSCVFFFFFFFSAPSSKQRRSSFSPFSFSPFYLTIRPPVSTHQHIDPTSPPSTIYGTRNRTDTRQRERESLVAIRNRKSPKKSKDERNVGTLVAVIFFDSKNGGGVQTYTAMEVRLLRKRSWTLAGRPAGRPSSRHVSTRMSGMACGTQSDFERSRFGGQKPTADGLSVLLVVVCDRFRSRNKIDDNFIFGVWFFPFFLIQNGTTCRFDNHDRKAHTRTHAQLAHKYIINLDFS